MPNGGALVRAGPSARHGRSVNAAGWQLQLLLGATSVLVQGGLGDRNFSLRDSGSDTSLHPKVEIQGGGS